MIGGIPLNDVLLASGALFVIGVAGALLRRNAISIFLSIEVMMNAANLALIDTERPSARGKVRSSCFSSSRSPPRKPPWAWRSSSPSSATRRRST
jgi:NADH-ubiquinone/plastoquinone oxidoreductase chain 4L